jgi:hypothetical protein
MSARQDIRSLIFTTRQQSLERRFDDAAFRILTDGARHSPGALKWAITRMPHMASFTSAELRLGSYEVHRS